MITISLNSRESMHAANVGILRRISAEFKNRTHANGLSRDAAPWDIDINGAMAELAVAKLLGVYWTGASELGAIDVLFCDVRHTTVPDGCLLIQKTDANDRPFVLVTGIMPEFNVCGWMLAGDAKQDQYWRTDTGRPCYFVPQSDLRLMEDLKCPQNA